MPQALSYAEKTNLTIPQTLLCTHKNLWGYIKVRGKSDRKARYHC
jgi:hypothetical protein